MRKSSLLIFGISAISLLALSQAASARDIQMARMVSPSAQTVAADRAAPAPHVTETKAPTTIGEETLRQLMATITPSDAIASPQAAQATPANHAKAKAKTAKHKHPHHARAKQPKHGAKHAPRAASSRFNDPRDVHVLKPCYKAHPVPAFLRETPSTPKPHVPAWQIRRLRSGPNA